MDPTPHRPPPPLPSGPTESDLSLPEGLEAGMLGGVVVIVVYLVPDLLAGDWLRTPALLGSLLVYGSRAPEGAESTAGLAALYTALHFAAWAAAGFAASILVRLADRNPGLRRLPALAFGLWIAGMLVADLRIAAVAKPAAHLWVGSAAAGVALAAYLRWRHPRAVAQGAGTSR